MEDRFVDRTLICSDCRGEFIFTAGEQLFFHDKEFKNDPKRCKPCKSRRSGLTAAANGSGPVAAGLSRTETRTECSECGIETTVPFKPTQGRPVLCRQCFQIRNRAAVPVAATPAPVVSLIPGPALSLPGLPAFGNAQTASALTELAAADTGESLSAEAATLAAASMASASPQSSVASAADLRSILAPEIASPGANDIPTELLAAAEAGAVSSDLMSEAPEA